MKPTTTPLSASREERTMPCVLTRAFAFAVGLLIVAAAIYTVPRAAGQTGPGWVSLFDGKTIGPEWDRVGESTWRGRGGRIAPPKHTTRAPGFWVHSAK